MGTAFAGKPILVVDDNKDVLQLLQRALARRKMACDLAYDGDEAAALLAENRYEIAFIDLRIPKKNGHKIIAEQLGLEERPYIFAITGINDPNILADLFDRGVDDILLKPFQLDIVSLKAKAILERRAQHKEKQDLPACQDITEKLDEATVQLKLRLAEIQDSFEHSIQELAQKREEVEAGYMDSVKVLTELVEQVDGFQGSHAVRVANLTVEMAKRLRLDRMEVHNLKLAALLHDIGQFAMPDKIHAKPPWMLTGEDKAAFQCYPRIGATLIGKVEGAESIGEIIATHAENFDGSGFPEGLKGEAIPLGARILRLADGVDTAQIYAAEAPSKDSILEHLNQHKGTEYDPALTAELIAMIPQLFAADEGADTEAVAIEALREGATLAEDIYDDRGRFLAREGAEVTPLLLRHLQNVVGLQQVLVFKPNEDAPVIPSEYGENNVADRNIEDDDEGDGEEE